MSLPINFLGREFAEAKLQIVEPAKDVFTIPLHFNPSEYKISKENTFAEIPIPGSSHLRCSGCVAEPGADDRPARRHVGRARERP